MIRTLVDVSLRFRRLVIALAVGTTAFGFAQAGNIPIDLLPEFSPTTVEVQTEALGLSAEEVEQFITVPLEQDLLNGIAFLSSIESASLPGLSSIVMTFEPGTDPLDARQVVAERLTQAVGAAGLPQVADLPQMLQPLSSMRRVAMIAMSSPTQSPIEQSVLARWVVVPRLMGVEGVANVSIWGFRDRQLQVLVDPEVLAERGISLGDVVRTTGNALEVSGLTFLEASTPGTGGFIDTPNQRLHVFHEQAITSPGELGAVVVEEESGQALSENGRPVVLGDISTIVEDHQPLIGDARCGESDCVLLVVEKFPSAGTPEVTAGIDAALEALRPGLGDVEFDSSIYRPAAYADAAKSNLLLALVLGSLLVLVALALVDWRMAVVVGASVLFSAAVSVLILGARNVTLNALLFAGLATGLVVVFVDAVVVGRAVLSSRSLAATAGPALSRRAYVDALLPVRAASICAVLAAGALVLPAFFLGGLEGAFMPELVATFLLIISAQLFGGLVVGSAMGMLLVEHGRQPVKPDELGQNLRRRYIAFGMKRFGRWTIATVTFVVVVVVAAAIIPTLDVSFSPDLSERDLVINVETAPGTSLARMREITSGLTSELKVVPGVASTTVQLGRAIRSDQVANVNEAEVWVNLTAEADRLSTTESIARVVADLPDAEGSVATYSERRVREVLLEPRQELVVRVYGDDQNRLRSTAERVRAAVSGLAGVENARLDLPPEEPTIHVEVDLDAAGALGIKPGDVRRTAAILLSGITVGNLFERQKVFDVVVWGDPRLRSTVDDVMTLPILLPDGGHRPLGELAKVEVVSNPAVVRHESVQQFIDVHADVTAGETSAIGAAARQAIDGLQFDLGYRAVVIGGFAEGRDARTRVVSIAIAAVIAVFLLLQAAVKSWRLAVVGLAVAPMAASGAIIAARLTGGRFGLGTTAGVIAAITVGVFLTVMLIRSLQRSRRDGEPLGIDQAVAGASAELVAGISSLAAGIAVAAPMAVMTGITGLELAGPMGVAAIGGFLTAGVFVLYLLPVAFLRWASTAETDTETDDLFALDLREVETAGRP